MSLEKVGQEATCDIEIKPISPETEEPASHTDFDQPPSSPPEPPASESTEKPREQQEHASDSASKPSARENRSRSQTLGEALTSFLFGREIDRGSLFGRRGAMGSSRFSYESYTGHQGESPGGGFFPGQHSYRSQSPLNHRYIPPEASVVPTPVPPPPETEPKMLPETPCPPLVSDLSPLLIRQTPVVAEVGSPLETGGKPNAAHKTI